MHTPEKKPHSVFRSLWKSKVPKEHFPVESPTLGPENRTINTPVSVVSGGHEVLKVVSGNEFMVNSRCRKVRIVPPHAHQLVCVIHVKVGVGNADSGSSREERVIALACGGHHADPPAVLGKLRNGNHCLLYTSDAADE